MYIYIYICLYLLDNANLIFLHRHSDRVCVLDNGKLAEMDSPQVLTQKADSLFAKLAQQEAAA